MARRKQSPSPPEAVQTDGAAGPVVLKRKRSVSAGSSFYIVGMGGSAGSLKAFEEFFHHVPVDTGAAFVVVPHLDPDQKTMMVELLQHCTGMPVLEASDDLAVKPNHVYVIPPNKNLALVKRKLQLTTPVAAHGRRLPIDFFLSTMADDVGKMAIGIILSGMGADGTEGVKAIKDRLGLTMVQDTASAKFSAMPQSAIDGGLADIIAPAAELAEKLAQYTRLGGVTIRRRHAPAGAPSTARQKIFGLLRTKTGHDFSTYKHSTAERRIERRMALHQIRTMAQYLSYLEENPKEIDLLFHELLIGVTSFFRDPEAFVALGTRVLPGLIRDKPKGYVFRIWVAACSTGEEAYSIAILLNEALAAHKKNAYFKVQIFATDIDQRAVEIARLGTFPPNIAADLTPERLKANFIETEDGRYLIRKDIREMIIFAPQNLIMDPPFTRLDMICCRNVMIYLNADVQSRLIPLFHYALNPDGILFLGSAETIGSYGDLFATVDGPRKLFRRKPIANPSPGIINLRVPVFPLENRAPAKAPAPPGKIAANLFSLLDRTLLDRFTPPAVVIDREGTIVHINGRTGRFLEPAAGQARLNLFDMAREGLKSPLLTALHHTERPGSHWTNRVRVKTNGDYEEIRLTVHHLDTPEPLNGLLVVLFGEPESSLPAETGQPVRAEDESEIARRASELEAELRYTKETLRGTIEQMDTSQEELRAANEELQSTNEELQSTNEELTTSREEMQSLNEELITVNAELHSKIETLSQANSDMRNLLNSTEIATVFLDGRLRIRRFTPPTARIIQLIPSDVGRPITQIVSNLKYDSLAADVMQVIETLMFKEMQIESTDGRWYVMRIMPYRTQDDVINGVVVTFVDISALKEMERELARREHLAESIINTIDDPLLVLDPDLRITTANRAFYDTFATAPRETIGQFIYDLGNRQWEIPELRKLLDTILPEKRRFENFTVDHVFPGVGRRIMRLNARQVYREGIDLECILLTLRDMTDDAALARQGPSGDIPPACNHDLQP